MAIDYAKLAKQHGGTASVDYGSLAASLGGTEGAPAPAIPKSEPPRSAASRFVHGVAETLNPITLIQGLGDMAGRGLAAVDEKGLGRATMDAAKGAVDAQSRGFINAWDQAGEGRTIEALGQAVSGALPIVGPLARGLGEEAAETGDLATAMGRGVGMGVAPRVMANAPGVVKAVGKPVLAAAKKAAPALAAGAGSAAVAAAAGASGPAAILAGLGGAIAEKVILPGKLEAAKRLMDWLKGEGAKATPAEIAAKAERAWLREELKALKQERKVEDIADKAELRRQRVMAKMDAKKPAQTPKPAPPKPAEAPKPVPEPKPAAAQPTGVHSGYQEILAKIKGKSLDEAKRLLDEEQIPAWLVPQTLERAGITAKSDVVTIGPSAGRRHAPFVDTRWDYLREQAAKRGNAPAQVKAQIEANKGKGAELAALLEEAPKPTARQQGEALHAKAKARAKKGKKQ